jgi:5-methylcytosine-specific restriction endonuclease McrA
VAFHRSTVQEEIYFRYALVIADAVSEREPNPTRNNYWGFVTARYRELIAGRIRPGPLLRQNLQLVDASERCEYCGSTDSLQWDHIIPLARGGPNAIDNLVRACRACNLRKSDIPLMEWAKSEALALSQLVRAKHLKLLLDAHRVQGTLVLQIEQLPGSGSAIVRIELTAFPFNTP